MVLQLLFGAFLMAKPSKKPKINYSFIPINTEVLSSIPWGMLKLNDRKILDRLFIEHSAHGGNENGRLIVTYDNFVAHGVRKQSIAESICRLEGLGFIETTRQGRPAGGDMKVPSTYLITTLPYPDGNVFLEPKNTWKQIKTVEEGKQRINNKKRDLKERTGFQQRAGKISAIKKKSPVAKAKPTSCITATETNNSLVTHSQLQT